MNRDLEGIEPEADPESVDRPDEGGPGHEPLGSPTTLDSEGYQSDSAGYQVAQEEYPWLAADADGSSAEAEDDLARDWMPAHRAEMEAFEWADPRG